MVIDMKTEPDGPDIAGFGRVISDPTRQELMRLLCCRWLCVSDLVDHLGVTQPTVSHHLAVLRGSRLVQLRRDGKQVFYTLNQDEVTVCCGRIMRTLAPERTVPEADEPPEGKVGG